MSNAIKGVKVGNEVKKIDYNSLDNLPQTDTTLSVSGKAADAKAVGDKLKPKELVLIETITVGENTQRITRNTTPDGVPFNLSAVYLNIKVPATSETHGGYITLLNESTYVAYSPIDVFTNTTQNIINYWLDNYHGCAIPSWKYSDSQVATQIRSRVRSSFDRFLPVKVIAIETNDSNINIPTGTTIEIYGIND